ncbi:MAG: hypothetical protein MAG451_02815 [Anaerolineales bacterium]|nr:hypothetical protein [Anaerolineales bacterium]
MADTAGQISGHNQRTLPAPSPWRGTNEIFLPQRASTGDLGSLSKGEDRAGLEILSSQEMATLTVFDAVGELVGRLVGPAGFESDFGALDTLSLGILAGGDWPSCSGYIDSVQIDTIDLDDS